MQAEAGYPEDLKLTLLRKWLLSAAAAALMPSNFRTRGVLVLQGDQGINKPSWVRSLVSDPALRDQLVKLDHHLDIGNKDSVIGAVTHWLVEIGELESSFRKDVARLKGFLTGTSDKVRRPYAKVESEYARRTVFVATVNDRRFLVDTTGNSRWWTIPVVRWKWAAGGRTEVPSCGPERFRLLEKVRHRAQPQLGGVWVAQKIAARIQKIGLFFFGFTTFLVKSVHAGQRADGAGPHAGGLQARHREPIPLLFLRRRLAAAALRARTA